MRNTKIKLKLLRDIKTDALLIYIRTILEDLIEKINTNEYRLNLGFEEFNEEIKSNILFLLGHLKEAVLNGHELKDIILYEQNRRTNQRLIPNDEALILYYNTIVKEIESNLTEGEHWIPEQVVFALLSEWIVEENKSTQFYPFLEEINYMKLLGMYEYLGQKNIDEELKKNVIKMYKIAASMIKQLKNTHYRVNNKRISKKRVKK
ncbi:MAG: hypothetical protein ACNI3C_00820 [Candidatus Marinarcus sp.]|uniref:hypothetical protein n=1 Tax=Candidatus Marinarcus sp. TaxID=3100987 RepID=UPI003AFF7E2C